MDFGRRGDACLMQVRTLNAYHVKEGEKPSKIISPHLNVGAPILPDASNGNTSVVKTASGLAKFEFVQLFENLAKDFCRTGAMAVHNGELFGKLLGVDTDAGDWKTNMLVEQDENAKAEEMMKADLAFASATTLMAAQFVEVYEVPFEVLIRRQIALLLDPSVQSARFNYDELIKMSHRCMENERQRFPVLKK
ncbi:dynamin central domain-containing protein [Artemisia annua]|uniref:Dynamin central domain-containing protein n=1 Tax=Artemisia annua TaxID=35608 RepID=A0A2U1MB53_ARTAN|nr:dynamin central domain-containing protein [Artemisia annua]